MYGNICMDTWAGRVTALRAVNRSYMLGVDLDHSGLDPNWVERSGCSGDLDHKVGAFKCILDMFRMDFTYFCRAHTHTADCIVFVPCAGWASVDLLSLRPHVQAQLRLGKWWATAKNVGRPESCRSCVPLLVTLVHNTRIVVECIHQQWTPPTLL